MQVPSPKVVLASTSDMECGFSRDLFAQWCVNGKNTIILTSRAADGTLTSDLVKNGGNRNISLLTGKRVKLSGQELEEHKRKEKEKEKVKGQLISECSFDVLNFPNQTNEKRMQHCKSLCSKGFVFNTL